MNSYVISYIKSSYVKLFAWIFIDLFGSDSSIIEYKKL